MKVVCSGTGLGVLPAGRCDDSCVLLAWFDGDTAPRVFCPVDGVWRDAQHVALADDMVQRWTIVEPVRVPVVKHLTSQLNRAMQNVEHARAQVAVAEAAVDEVVRRDMALEVAAADPDMAIVVLQRTHSVVKREVRVKRVTKTQIVTSCGSNWRRKSRRNSLSGEVYHARIGRADGILTHVDPKWTADETGDE